ncbi:MAG: MaoC family dehydratase N-terminal domain-containing protein [Deltaproteobacteria bacterium]|nr:MaoC family dehydratase N-terminal domain-containing protein [Deltaproteobacteria bacterium]
MQKGITFEGFHRGDRFTTGRRTVTETDVMQFVCLVGLFEPLFIDAEYIRNESLFGERIAPGSLTFGMAEGLTVQTGIIHGTAMAFVGLERMRLYAPVKVGDTIQVEIEVLDAKEVKSRGGGIVVFRQVVRNQQRGAVMEYDVSRMIRGARQEEKEGRSQ